MTIDWLMQDEEAARLISDGATIDEAYDAVERIAIEEEDDED